MIIWGSKTKREGRGFILKTCPFCRGERVHFVVQSKSKFTLYFIPTFTTSTKALLICTECEREEEIDGSQATSYLQAALPRHLMLDELRRRQPIDGGGQQQTAGAGQAQSPIHSLAVAMVVLATQISLTDGSMDDAEAAAIGQGFATIYSVTKSEPVRQAAGLVPADLGDIMAWISSPATGPIALMLADAGRVLRQLQTSDQSRYIGQMAWLCDSVAVASGGSSEAELEQADSSLAMLGFSPREVADALAFCEHNGG